MRVRNTFVRYWLPVCILCAGIFLESSFATPDLGYDWALFDWPYWDKLAHGLIFFALSVLICRALRAMPFWRRRFIFLVLLGIALATLYGLSDEVHQSFVAARSADPADFLADFIGAIIGALMFMGFSLLLRPKINPETGFYPPEH